MSSGECLFCIHLIVTYFFPFNIVYPPATVSIPKGGVLLVTYSHLHFKYYTAGAERLIVDAAVELATYGYDDVHVLTALHDKTRCFEETLAGNAYQI